MSDRLLTIRNHHVAGCGDPPIIDGAAQDQYVGYFENQFGDQWVFTRDRKTGVATLRGGDLGWNTAVDVTEVIAGKLMLNASEMQWLESCIASSQSILQT